MELKFSVAKQTMIRDDRYRIASHSVDFLRASFKFMSEEWAGKVKTAIFNGYAQILTDDSCIVPWEALTGEKLVVSVYGVEGSSRVTTNTVKIDIAASGYEEGETPSEPTPTVYEQILDRIDSIAVGEISPEVLATAVSEYLEAHPVEGVTAETLTSTLADYVLMNDLPQSLPASDVCEWAKQAQKPSYTASEVGASPTGHTHDERYYTESEVDAKLASRDSTISDISSELQSHDHNEAYYTKAEILERLSGLSTGGGSGGADGVGISDIIKTATSGLVDTYTIYLSDGTTSTFTVTNGYSPTATVSKTGNKTTISVTDKNGTTAAEVLDGANGFTRADIEQIIAEYIEEHEIGQVEPDEPDEPDEPTTDTVPEGTWQLKTTTQKRYVIIGTDDDNVGNPQFLRLLRTYNFPYTMNVEAENLNRNIGTDLNSGFTDTDAPSLFPNNVTVTELGQYITEYNLGEVAQHGASASVLWQSSNMTDTNTNWNNIYNQYVSSGGTKTKEELKLAIMEELADSDASNDAPYVARSKSAIEEAMGFKVKTVGIWGGTPTCVIDGITVSLNTIKGASDYDWKGKGYYAAAINLNYSNDKSIYAMSRLSGTPSQALERIPNIRIGGACEFFWHYPFNDATMADFRTLFDAISTKVNNGEVEVVTRYQYYLLGEHVQNPITSVALTVNASLQTGGNNPDTNYTVTVTYQDGTTGQAEADVIIDKSAVDVTTVGTYTVNAYYRGFTATAQVNVVSASSYTPPTELKNTPYWFVIKNTDTNTYYAGNVTNGFGDARVTNNVLTFANCTNGYMNGWKSTDGTTWIKTDDNKINRQTIKTTGGDNNYTFGFATGVTTNFVWIETSNNFTIS